MCLGIPGKILSIHGEEPMGRMASVDFGGVTKNNISIAFTPEAKVGDYVIIHVGFALSIVSETDAQMVMDTLKEMDFLKD